MGKDGEEEKKDDEKKDDEKKDEEKNDDEKKEEEEEEEEDGAMEEEIEESPPTVELSSEEKAMPFRKTSVKDLTPMILSASFTKFALPSKDEGFGEIKYEWHKTAADKAKKAREDAAKAKKEAEKAAKGAEEKEAEDEEKKADGKSEKEKNDEANKDEEKEDVEMEDETEKKEEIDFTALDVFGVDDILDIGDGSPIFKELQNEDWALMTLRFELHLLAHAFQRDVDDPERLGITMEHLPFYYNKYFKKPLNAKDFGVDSIEQVCALASDCVFVSPKKVLESQLECDMESSAVFVKLTEHARRHRALRIAFGDEDAKLNLNSKLFAGNQVHQKTFP